MSYLDNEISYIDKHFYKILFLTSILLYVCHCANEVREQLGRISSFLPSGFWALNLGHKAWWQVPFAAELFLIPCGKYFIGDLLSHLTIPIIVYLDYFQFFK